MRVLYVTPAGLDQPNAAAIRNLGMAIALAVGGHETVIVSLASEHIHEDFQAVLSDWPTVHFAGSVAGASDGSSPRGGLSPRDLRLGNRFGSMVRRADAIIYYGTFLPTVVQAQGWARRYGTPFVLDVTEWYDGRAMRWGRLGPMSAMNALSMHLVVPGRFPSLAVSTSLGDHLGAKGASTLVVPPLMALPRLGAPTATADGIVNVSLVGSDIGVGGKDRLALQVVSEAVQTVDPHGERLKIHVLGHDSSALEAAIGQELPASFLCHGSVSWMVSLGIVGACDFTLYLRRESRRVVMGFPSKVAESLLLGTPIVGLPTGDLRSYMIDGVNSVHLPDDSAEALATALTTKWDLASRGEISEWASGHFTPSAHSHRICHFLESLCR